MTNLTRKQREIANRHALFLDIAKKTLAEDGFHNLSMESIADIAEYSKGTVYQHFSCKEEILIQLCNNAMTQLLALFKRTAIFDAPHRDRLIAVTYAHTLWTRLDNGLDMLQHLTMHGVRDKVTELSLQRHDELEHSIINTVAGIVSSAIEADELREVENMNAHEIVFGLWSLSFGGQLLQASEIPLEKLGVAHPGNSLLRMLSKTLDGLGWQPLHTEARFEQLLESFRNELFATEYNMLRSISTSDNAI